MKEGKTRATIQNEIPDYYWDKDLHAKQTYSFSDLGLEENQLESVVSRGWWSDDVDKLLQKNTTIRFAALPQKRKDLRLTKLINDLLNPDLHYHSCCQLPAIRSSPVGCPKRLLP